MKALEHIETAGQIARAVVSKKVSYLIIFVTAKCNLLCEHCFYTEEIQNAKSKKELTLAEYQQIAQKIGPLTNVNFTGGEPFIRQDLSDIAWAFRQHTGVPFLGITSNGLLRNRLIECVEQICSQKGPYFLKLGISVDGFEAVHDKTRGQVGAFKKTLDTIQALKPLREKYSNLMVYVSTTITKYNQDEILNFIDFVHKELPVDAHYLGYIRGRPKVEETKEVSPEGYRKAIDHLNNKWNQKSVFFNMLNVANNLMLSVNQHIVETNKYFMPCVAGEKMLTITEEGLLKPCEVLEQIGVSPYVMGNLREYDYDANKILVTPQAQLIRKKIINEHCYCSFECANQASIVFKPSNLLKAATLHLKQKMNHRLNGS